MIKVEHMETFGLEAAIRGMRNPKNSWDKSDSIMCGHGCDSCKWFREHGSDEECPDYYFILGYNDEDLLFRLVKAGEEHRKVLRQITIYMDITAPLYWWKEFDTYKVGTTANSCSTMHKISSKEFTLDDFSHEHLTESGLHSLKSTINDLNSARHWYLQSKQKCHWWDMIQLLPTSYNQKRTVSMNYEVALKMLHQRENHKLDEWNEFRQELLKLPYMREIWEASYGRND